MIPDELSDEAMAPLVAAVIEFNRRQRRTSTRLPVARVRRPLSRAQLLLVAGLRFAAALVVGVAWAVWL